MKIGVKSTSLQRSVRLQFRLGKNNLLLLNPGVLYYLLKQDHPFFYLDNYLHNLHEFTL